MANHYSDGPVSISIPESVNENGITMYVIKIAVGETSWTVKHRFRDFSALHEVLIEAGVAKDSLPQKKLLGNKDPSFIMQRRKDLESYIQSVFQFLERSTPEPLVEFLNLNKFEINFLLKDLARQHFDRLKATETVDAVEIPGLEEARWTPLEMFAISTRMKSPLPTREPVDEKHDFTNVADRVCQMKRLRLQGSDDKLGTSNVIFNNLKYDFLAFKSLDTLVLVNVVCNCDVIGALGKVRDTLAFLQVNRCNLQSIANILLCDTKYWNQPKQLEDSILDNNANWTWNRLEHLDLRYNSISHLDLSLKFAPKLSNLLLGTNKVKTIENLASLAKLTVLELADNDVAEVDALNVKLGQIQTIDLSHNKIGSLEGFSRLYSLKKLNVAANRVKELEKVFFVSQLPCLEELNLQGNFVTTVVDYRLKVLESFGKRCPELCLDNEYPSQTEVDKVSVLMALRVSREGRSPTSLFGNLPRRVSSEHF